MESLSLRRHRRALQILLYSHTPATEELAGYDGAPDIGVQCFVQYEVWRGLKGSSISAFGFHPARPARLCTSHLNSPSLRTFQMLPFSLRKLSAYCLPLEWHLHPQITFHEVEVPAWSIILSQ